MTTDITKGSGKRMVVPSTSKSAGKHFAGMASPGSPEQAPLIPYIKVCDNNKLLPKYSAAIQNQADDLVPAEDLDAIQLELEMLLSTVALRYRVLKSEMDSVDKADDRRGDRKMPSSPGKKKRLEEKQKLRESAGKMFGHHMKKMKNPFIPPSPAPSQNNTDDSMDALQYNIHHHHQPEPAKHHHFPKNDTPNKFWLTVEPYCMPINQEDVKMLDDLLEEFKGPLMPPIPELGPHYSTQWAADDIKEEQDGKNKKLTNGDVKKNEKIMGEGVTGPLTQRLVSALMEENMLPDGNCTSNENSMDMMPQRSAVSMLKNGISIERRLRKELIEQGILDADDMPKSQQDDEILTEIKRVRNELSTIAEYNSNEIRKLQKMAIEEMKRMEIKKKLDQVDVEIIECYKRIRASRLKKTPITKQEREEVYRYTEEQRRLSDQLASTRKLPVD